MPLGAGRGLNVPLGGNLGGGERGSGSEFGSKFGVTFGSLFSIWRTRQHCSAESSRSTHWSGCDEGGGRDGNKDSEMHTGVLSQVVLFEGDVGARFWSSNSCTQPLLL